MRLKPLLVALLLAAIAAPACAETIPGADETHGQTLGLGYAGLSYDFGFGRTSLGAGLNFAELGSPNQRVQAGVRALHAFFEQGNVSAAWIGGLQYDPGTASQHALITPDLGLGIAYRFVLGNLTLVGQDVGSPTLVVRANVTLAPWRNVGPGIIGPNLFQSFGLGPNTMLALAYEVNRNLEISVGGGTLVGMQLRY